MGRLVFSHHQESRAPSHITVTCEGEHHHSKRPTLPPAHPALHPEHDAHVVEYPWARNPGYVSSQLIVHPLLVGGDEEQKSP